MVATWVAAGPLTSDPSRNSSLAYSADRMHNQVRSGQAGTGPVGVGYFRSPESHEQM